MSVLVLAVLCTAAAVAAVSFHQHKKISADTYYLGKFPHPRHRLKEVEGYAFLHNHGQAPAASAAPSTSKSVYFGRASNNNQTASADTSRRKRAAPACWSPIAVGAVWKTSLGFYINARNNQGLSTRFIVSSLLQAQDAWNCALRSKNRLVIGPLLGVRADLSGSDINIAGPDGSNVVGFGSIDGHAGAIGVTILYGMFTQNAAFNEIVEFKMLLDSQHYVFGDATLRSNTIDLLSTVTHEMGHAFGNEDIYDPDCSDVTMFGSASAGESKKRTLETADVAGIQTLYPNQN